MPARPLPRKSSTAPCRTGIYLDLDGYPEDEQQSALAALTEAAGCGPEDVIHSGSGLLCYIPLGQE